MITVFFMIKLITILFSWNLIVFHNIYRHFFIFNPCASAGANSSKLRRRVPFLIQDVKVSLFHSFLGHNTARKNNN